MNLKNLLGLKETRYGFYVNLAFGALLLITGIIFSVTFQNEFMVLYAKVPFDTTICALLFVAGILTIGLSMFKITRPYAPYVGGIFILTVLCLFIKDIYLFVMNCFVDIDYHTEDFFNPIFLVTLIFIIITFIVGVVNCFLPQVKEVEKECACECCKCEEQKEETINE